MGTGASAVQFVPQIAPVVEHLYLHQRTPPFVVPRRDRAVSGLRKLAYRKVPSLQRLSRLRIYAMFEALLSVFVGHGERRKAAVRKAALDHLAKQVPDEALRQKLVPHYEPGCKRLLLSDDYYPSLTRPNVEVVESPVASFTAHEVVGQDGIARPVDVVIMGTGFEAAEPPYAEHIVGRDGVRLAEMLEGERRRGLRRLDRRRLPQPVPDDRAQLDAGPQLHDLHDRVAHQLHRQRSWRSCSVPACGPSRSSRPCSGVTTSGCRPDWRTRSGSRAGAAAGTSTTGAATRRCGRTTPGSSAG